MLVLSLRSWYMSVVSMAAPTPTFPMRIGVVSQQPPPRTQNADASPSSTPLSLLLIFPRTPKNGDAAASNCDIRF